MAKMSWVYSWFTEDNYLLIVSVICLMNNIETEKYPKEDQNQNIFCISPVCVFLTQHVDFGGGLGYYLV